MNDLLSLVSAFLMLILVLLAAWGFSRFLGKRWNGIRKAKYMRIVDQLVVGQDRQVFILEMEKEEECFLIGSSPEGIRILTRLSGDYAEDTDNAPASPQGRFQEYLRESLAAIRRGKDEKANE